MLTPIGARTRRDLFGRRAFFEGGAFFGRRALSGRGALPGRRALSGSERSVPAYLALTLALLALTFGCADQDPEPAAGLLSDYASGVDAAFHVETFSLGDPSLEITYPTLKPYMGFPKQAGKTPLPPNGVEFKVTNIVLGPGKAHVRCRLNGTLVVQKAYKSPAAIADLGGAGLKTLTCYLVDESGGVEKEVKAPNARHVRNFYVSKPCNADSECASADVCDYEQCVDLKCFYAPKDKCCNDNWSCGQGEICSDPGTAQSICSTCSQDSECDDGDECTTDKCIPSQGGCSNVKADPLCCTSKNPACSDGMACTTDTCDAVKKQCQFTKIPGSCCNDKECDPGDPCLVAQCIDAECRTGPDVFKHDCCSPKHNPTCNDRYFCTMDKCDTKDPARQMVTDGVKWTQCKHWLDPSKAGANGEKCCDPLNQTNECDDANACTTDACVNYTCRNTAVAECCLQDKDCDDHNGCTTNKCVKDCQGVIFNGLCYQGYKDQISFLQAKAACQGQGGVLAPATSAQENEIVRQAGVKACGTGSGVFWIGLNDIVKEGTYVWYSGAPYGGYTNWAAGEPNNSGDEDGGQMYPDTGKWNDGRITDSHCYVCKLGASSGVGACEYVKPDPLCCESTSDCNDGKFCTSDSCNLATNKCSYVKTDPSCCDTDVECSDGDICTTDFCVNGFCMHGPDSNRPNCCTKNANCDDNNPCTIDSCDTVKQTCQFIGNGDPECCVGNNDCTDNDCSTLDFCASNNKCAYKADPTKCSKNIDCDDGLACTLDTCDTSGPCGVCKHQTQAACCDGDKQCDDGNPCTINTCVSNKCEKAGRADCCLDDKDAMTACDDGNPCTIDYCVNNGCRHTRPKNGCCHNDTDCNDGWSCTIDQCIGISAQNGKGTCEFAKDPQNPSCVCTVAQAAAGVECNDNNGCTADSCDNNGQCVNTPIAGCCQDKFDCNDGNACTHDACVFGECLNYEAAGDQALCCKKATEAIDCAYLNSSCAKGICESQPDGSRKCVSSPLDVCTVQIGYCQDFSAGTNLKAIGWNPGNVKSTAASNWKVHTKGGLGPDQYAMLDWTPTRTDYETCLQSPIIQAAGTKKITIQYDRLYDIVSSDATITIKGSLDGANADWTKATLIDAITPKVDEGPATVDLVLPPGLTGSNGLRLAFCVAGTSTAKLTNIGLDNVCVVKGGKPAFTKCPPNQIAKFGDLLAIPLKAKDPDPDAILSFSLVNSPKFVTLSSGMYFWLDDSWNTRLEILPKNIADVGMHTITVKVSDGFLYSTCTFDVTVIADTGLLVWRPIEVPALHGDALEAALKQWVTANWSNLAPQDRIVQQISDISLFSTLTKFKAIFISLGVYPKKHVLTESEALNLKLYLQQQGKLYMEGGDTWAFDAPTSLHGFFHVKTAVDESPFGVEGPLMGTGVYQNAKQDPIKYYDFKYNQSFTYNSGNDLIGGNLSVSETRDVLQNKGANQQFYVQVGHDDPTKYRTIASSILFSGLLVGNDKPQDAMERILTFFQDGFVDCVKDAQCNDQDGCTKDTCLNSRCVHDNICNCDTNAAAIKCGDTVTISNTDPGATSDVKTYNCDPNGTTFDGKEFTRSFSDPQSRPVELQVTSITNPKARLFVLNGGLTNQKQCDSDACFATDANGGSGTIKFASAAGNTYYVVLDAPAGQTAQATFKVFCSQGEICDDQQDNNGNNLVDCNDLASCCGFSKCVEICDDKDNDCDGYTDEGCDDDGDQYCDGAMTSVGSPAVCPKGTKDCVDNDATVNPGVAEICLNGKDDNCNGAQDEEGAAGCKNYYVDVDGDKFGTGQPKCLCAPKGNYTSTKGGDCDDTDPKINPIDNPEICGNGVDDDCTGTQNDLNAIGCRTFYTDADQDGFGTQPQKCLCFAEGASTAVKPGDCNDADVKINPLGTEICDGLDNDCDGFRDEGCDDDGDLYCDFNMAYKAIGADKQVCAQASQGANLNVQCAAGAKITQVSFASYGQPTGKCGGYQQQACHAKTSLQKVKDACLGKSSCIVPATDANFGTPCTGQKQLVVQVICTGNNGVPPSKCPKGPGDTDDTDPAINPEGIEICDGKDNDSDFKIDEGCDDDGDDFCDADMIVIGAPPVCPKGKGDCDDTVFTTNPGVNENCATVGIDDNCNGTANDVDADNCQPLFYDNDKDKYGTQDFKCLCKPIGLYAAKLTADCNDHDDKINPGVLEVCDNIDNNCNGQVNEGCDDDKDGYCDAALPYDPLVGQHACINGKGDCDDTNPKVNPGKAEICGNGLDDDCDGSQNDPGAVGCSVFFSDGDQDGFGSTTNKCLCVAEGTFTATKKGDCDDTKASVNPVAAEICNNVDDNCDGVVDEDCDVDGDGYCGTKSKVTHSDRCPKTVGSCDGEIYGAACYSARDQARTFAGATKYCADLGGHLATITDAVENEVVRKAALTRCGAGKSALIGLDDTATEGTFLWVDGTVLNYKHWTSSEPNNAGGKEDAVAILTTAGTWNDVDGTLKSCFVCEIPFSAYPPYAGDDCDDLDKTVYPGATEACDDVDTNCDGVIDDGCDKDKDGYCAATLAVSNPAPKVCPSGGGDCDDHNQDQNPGAAEVCGNGIDDNCNGSQNDKDAINCLKYFYDSDKDTYGLNASLCLCSPAGSYTATRGGDCADTNAAIHPGVKEICGDGVDNDCSGTQNDPNATGCSTFLLDQDGDKYGLDGVKKCLCFGEGDYTAVKGGDCNDTNAAIHLGGEEICDNADNDCDSKVDEGCNADGDGYCTAKMITKGLPTVCPKGGGDCNDTDAGVNPGLPEICDNKDNNCDSPYTAIQLAAQRKKWEDARTLREQDQATVDGTDAAIVAKQNALDAKKTTCGTKPTPTCPAEIKALQDQLAALQAQRKTQQAAVDAQLVVEKAEYATYIKMLTAGGTSDEGCDDDGDDWCDANMKLVGKSVACPLGGGDCEDTNKSIHPGQKEDCSTAADDDCSGSTNDPNALGCKKFGYDYDADTYYDAGAKQVCLCKAAPPLTATAGGDCDDKNKLVNPGVVEICDNVDNNCDGKTDEGCDDDADNYCDSSMATIGKPKVCPKGGGDCNDGSAAVHPGAKEICNDGIDQDCDGSQNGINAVNCSKFYHDGDGDGWAVDVSQCLCSPMGNFKISDVNKIGDCDDTTQAINPSRPEVCGDGVDNNCNGTQNDPNAQGCSKFYKDFDKDGYGGGTARCQCVAEGVYVTTVAGDCVDTDAAINPGAKEICDNKDNNCQGVKDEGCDDDGDGYCDATMKMTAAATCAKSLKPAGGGYFLDYTDAKTTAVAGTSGKGVTGQWKCPVNHVAIGVAGRTDGHIHQIRLHCAVLKVDGSLGNQNPGDTMGTSTGGQPKGPIVGPSGLAMVSLNTRHLATGELASVLGQFRSPADIAKITSNASSTAGSVFAGTAASQDTGRQTCPDGYVVTGVHGTSAIYPFNLGLLCTRLSPAGGLVSGDDCVDTDKTVNPGAVEVCDDKDQDCDGEADNGCDSDLDGYCDKAMTVIGTPAICQGGKGDCDDTNQNVHPGKAEICDDVDNDCNGTLDDGCDVDGDDFCTQAKSVIGKPKVCPKGAGDCNDNDKAINPAAKEICDGIDNNCAAGADEVCKDTDGDGYCVGNTGISSGCPKGGLDCDDTNPAINPGQVEDCLTEADDDCSGTPNDKDAANCRQWYADGDGDTYGAGASECRCYQTGKLVTTSDGDCDDADKDVNPAAPEVCDGKNNDCDFKLLKGVQFNGKVFTDMNLGSHGGGFHRFRKEYWYPQWSGGNTLVRRYDLNHKFLGQFYTGTRYNRQIDGDLKTDTYYIARDQDHQVRKQKGTTSSTIWVKGLSYASAVTNDGDLVYVQRYQYYPQVYIFRASDGAQQTTVNLDQYYGQYNWTALVADRGKLYRGVYADRFFWRYDIVKDATGKVTALKHDGLKFQVAPTVYTTAFNGKDLCVSSTNNNLYCYELPAPTDPVPGSGERQVGLYPHGNGLGFHPFRKEFWIPQWSSGTTNIYRYDGKYEPIKDKETPSGYFNNGRAYVMQLAGDPNEDTYYTITYSSSSGLSRVRKQKGTTSAIVWEQYPGTTYIAGLAVNGKAVYVMRHNSSTVYVRDKKTGAGTATLNLDTLPGTLQGGLLVTDTKLYRMTTDRWVHRYNLADGKYDGTRFQLMTAPYGLAFTGQDFCYANTSGPVWCQQLPGTSLQLQKTYQGSQPPVNSHGFGFHPKLNEYWSPAYSGGNTRIYRYNKNRSFIGSFMHYGAHVYDIEGDPNTDTFYTAEFYNGFRKHKGHANYPPVLWQHDMGQYHTAVATDGTFVYGQRYQYHNIVRKLRADNGQFVADLTLDNYVADHNYGALQVKDGKLYRGTYSQRQWMRYDLATGKHDGVQFQVAPTTYNSSLDNNGELCVASTGGTVYCYKLPASTLDFTPYTAGQNTHSHGAGYHPFYREYWYPQWSTDIVHRVGPNGEPRGTFTTGQRDMMQLAGEVSTGGYYTANWGYGTVSKWQGNTGVAKRLWNAGIGGTVGGVAVNDDYVYAVRYNSPTVWRLRKDTGSTHSTFNLNGGYTGTTYGGLQIVQGKLLRGSSDRWVYRYDLQTGTFDGTAFQSRIPIENSTWDGREYCVAQNAYPSVRFCYPLTDPTKPLSDEGCDDDADGFCDSGMAITAAGTQNVCPKTKMQCDGVVVGDRCYKVNSGVGKTWTEAQATCSAWGGDLVSVHGAGDNKVVQGKAIAACGAGKSYWIGATDKAYNGSYQWSDGSVLDYTNWKAGEPTSSYEADFFKGGNLLSQSRQSQLNGWYQQHIQDTGLVLKRGLWTSGQNDNYYFTSLPKPAAGVTSIKVRVRVWGNYGAGNEYANVYYFNNAGQQTQLGNVGNEAGGNCSLSPKVHEWSIPIAAISNQMANGKLRIYIDNMSTVSTGCTKHENSVELLYNYGFTGVPTWKLCYKSSLDGRSSYTFHTKCNGQGESIAIIKTNTGRLFGGLTEHGWLYNYGYTPNSEGFLFSLDTGTVMKITNTNYSTYTTSSYGPTFGGGHDIYVNSDLNYGYTNLGHSFQCPVAGYGSSQCGNYLAGQYSGWKADEIEVYVRESVVSPPKSDSQDYVAADANGQWSDVANTTKLGCFVCGRAITGARYGFGDDCADTDASVSPANVEICDNLDNNCNGQVDEGCDDDGDQYCDSAMQVIGSPAVCLKGSGDCDDTDKTINPGAQETCNTDYDDNCNGLTSEVNAIGCTKLYMDNDGDGWGTASFQCLCETTQCQADLWGENFDGKTLSGWTMQRCAVGTSKTPSGCKPDSSGQGWQHWNPAVNARSLPGALYYGDKNTVDFAFGASAGTATSPAIQIPANANPELTMSVYLDGEDRLDHDKLYINVLVGGAYQKTIAAKATEYGGGFKGSKLLSETQMRTLNKWYGKSGQQWQLLYRSTDHGNTPQQWHARVDNQGATLTVLSYLYGGTKWVFGGYNPHSWNGGCGYQGGSGSWLFSLTRNTKHDWFRYNGPYTCSHYGPTFGSGHDMNYGRSWDFSNNYAYLGYSYRCIPGYGNGSSTCQNWLAGHYSSWNKNNIVMETWKPATTGAQDMAVFVENGKWNDIKVDLSAYAGKKIQLQFYFQTVDGTANDGMGVVIDELKLRDANCSKYTALKYGDCDDTKGYVYPTANAEICDGQDNNCNGVVDESCDTDQDGYCDANKYVSNPTACPKTAQNSKSCKSLLANPPMYVGQIATMNTHSHGGGWHPRYKEYWYPGWSGGTIYRYDAKRQYLGAFGSGWGQIMDLQGDPDPKLDQYYTANWGYYRVAAWQGKTSNQIWSYSLGYYAAGVDADLKNVYAIRAENNRIWVLRKTDGANIANMYMQGSNYISTWSNGGFFVTDGKIYRAAAGTRYVERFTVPANFSGNANFDGLRWQAATPIYNASFDGSEFCVSANSSSNYCYNIKSTTCKRGDDCNDLSKAQNPGEPEKCDDIDNNCDGRVDEDCDKDGDGYCDEKANIVGLPQVCPKGGGDCADNDKAQNPGTKEVCDGKDNNCNGATDEFGATGCSNYYYDGDQDGYGTGAPRCLCPPTDGNPKPPPPYNSKTNNDCNDKCDRCYPGATEICDDLDNDCDKVVDENCDKDGDGYCDKNLLTIGTPKACKFGGNDCNDLAKTVNPGIVELCNNKDENCNGITDENASDACKYIPNSISQCVAGQCKLLRCAAGFFDINNITSDGCECNGTDQYEPNDTCINASTVSSNLYDNKDVNGGSGGTAAKVSGRLVASLYKNAQGQIVQGDYDWYKVYVKDTPDVGSNACDHFGVRVRFLRNPGNHLRFDIYKGACPNGSPSQKNGLCCGRTDFHWFTRFKSYTRNWYSSWYSEYGQCPCTSVSDQYDTSRQGWNSGYNYNGHPGPYCQDQRMNHEQYGGFWCKPRGYRKTRCQDDSAWYYIRVYHDGGPPSCGSYEFEVTNGVYSGNHRGLSITNAINYSLHSPSRADHLP